MNMLTEAAVEKALDQKMSNVPYKMIGQDVSVYYGEKRALFDVNLNVRENTVTALIGGLRHGARPTDGDNPAEKLHIRDVPQRRVRDPLAQPAPTATLRWGVASGADPMSGDWV